MKDKTPKKGRPMVKDKMIAYTFTIKQSIRTEALCKAGKTPLDIILRKKMSDYAKAEKN